MSQSFDTSAALSDSVLPSRMLGPEFDSTIPFTLAVCVFTR